MKLVLKRSVKNPQNSPIAQGNCDRDRVRRRSSRYSKIRKIRSKGSEKSSTKANTGAAFGCLIAPMIDSRFVTVCSIPPI